MSGRAGFLELETKSKPARERGPRRPGARLPSGCRFPDSAEHVFCGCHAAGRRGAVGSSWPGPRLPSGRKAGREAGGQGGHVPTAPFLSPLPLCLCLRPGEQPLLVPPSARLSSLLFKAASRGAPRHLGRGAAVCRWGDSPGGDTVSPGTTHQVWSLGLLAL